MNRFIYITFGIICMVAIILFSLKQCASVPYVVPETECGAIKIEADNFTPQVGDSVLLEAFVKSMVVETYQWQLKNFAGRVIDSSTVATPVFQLDTVGDFTVLVQLNGQCTDSTLLTVQPKEEEVKPGSITAPSSIYLGQRNDYAYVGDAKEEDRLEWQFGESGDVDANGRDVSYTYTTPGRKSIRVTYKGEILAERPVRVSRPPGTSVPTYTNAQFRQKLQAIANAGSSSQRNAIYKELKKAVRDENIPVIVNGTTYQFYDYFIELSLSGGSVTVNNVRLSSSNAGITRIVVDQT